MIGLNVSAGYFFLGVETAKFATFRRIILLHLYT